MSAHFTVPQSFLSQVDSRPMLKILVDVSESIGLLKDSLVGIAKRTSHAIDDNTAQYIANALLTSSMSPVAHPTKDHQIAAFFHSSLHAEMKDVICKVKDVFSKTLFMPSVLLKPIVGKIYPCRNVGNLSYRSGNLAVLNYHVGADPLDSLDDTEDEYAGMVEEDKIKNEALDEELFDEMLEEA